MYVMYILLWIVWLVDVCTWPWGCEVVRLCGCGVVCVGCARGDVGMWGCVVVWPCGCVAMWRQWRRMCLCGSTLFTEAALKYPEGPASEGPEGWPRYGRAATHVCMPHQAHGMGWRSLLMLHNALCMAAGALTPQVKAWVSQAP